MQRELDTRPTPSEAIRIAAELLEQFPNCKAEDGFIGTLAKILAAQPRSVAMLIVDPLRGLAYREQFLSIASAAEWCEKQSVPMYQQLSRARRVNQQMVDHNDWRAPKPQSLLDAGKAWLERKDCTSKLLTGNDDREVQMREARSSEALAEVYARRNSEIIKDWESVGQKTPTIGGVPVSAELVRLVREQEARDSRLTEESGA